MCAECIIPQAWEAMGYAKAELDFSAGSKSEKVNVFHLHTLPL